MRLRMIRTERQWRRRAESYRAQLAGAHVENARLARELATETTQRINAERQVKAPMQLASVTIEWFDGYREVLRPMPRPPAY